MNRSRYLTRRLDHIDRAIIAALYEDGRRTIKDVAELLDMASPSITARIDKLKDAGAIRGYTVLVDPGAFGLTVAAYVRMRARPGEMKRVAQLLEGTPEVVEADHITGETVFGKSRGHRCAGTPSHSCSLRALCISRHGNHFSPNSRPAPSQNVTSSGSVGTVSICFV